MDKHTKARKDGPAGSGHVQLTETQVAQLDRLGFVWRIKSNKSGPPQSWEEMYAELRGYHQEHGDCLVPVKYGKLGSWFSIQRQKRRPTSCPRNSQIQSLNALEFAWQVNPAD